MPKSCEPQSVIDAAEQAAAAGHYASAEQLLRDAARLQEADLGPLHPDLANTLNNLGILCEFTDKPADAEFCYRKAYAIATAVLEPDHPFAATSRKNLKSFCDAHGLPVEFPAPLLVESPAPLPANASEQEPEVVSSVRPHVRPWHAELRRFALRGLPSRFTMMIIALGLCGLASIVLVTIGPWLHSNEQAEPAPVALTPSLAERSVPSGPLAASKGQARAASVKALTLASATLCRDLSTSGGRGLEGGWRCDPASGPFDSGALFFLTRLKSPNETRVQHRWYRDDRLYRAVDLRVRANELDGYRTYSRYTMTSKSAGNWRVELRSSDGVLLHEERFVVRSLMAADPERRK